MSRTTNYRRIAYAATLTMAFCGAIAKAETPDNSLTIGYARVSFNSSSSELSGPPGTTPPGVTLGTKDTDTIALVYERKLTGPLSLVVQVGAPPQIRLTGQGAAAALGEVGSTRAWFPAVLVKYSFPLPGFTPYVSAGVNYTWFKDNEIRPGYTAAFGGTDSDGDLDSHTGPVAKIGATMPLGSRWTLDLSYSRYWINTSATVNTDTPGLGVVSRTIDLTADPDVFGLTVGFSF